MSVDHAINEMDLISATEAGKRFGYTKDYFLLLIKTNKISGKKIGRKWFVSVPSAQAYFEEARLQKIARSEKIRLERKQELAKASEKNIPEEVVVSVVQPRLALVETAVIVVLGIAVGSLGYMGTSSSRIASSASASSGSELVVTFFAHMADSLYAFVNPQSQVSVSREETPKISEQVGDQEATLVHANNSESRSMVVAPASEMSTSTVKDIQDSFSDEVDVSVDETNPNTGIITPVFKEKKGEEYRFIMVPVTPNVDTP